MYFCHAQIVFIVFFGSYFLKDFLIGLNWLFALSELFKLLKHMFSKVDKYYDFA